MSVNFCDLLQHSGKDSTRHKKIYFCESTVIMVRYLVSLTLFYEMLQFY